MKRNWKFLAAAWAAALMLSSSFCHAEESALQNLRIKIVNFKTCIEESKLGKQEQAMFEGLKKKMDNLLEQKEKELQEISAKFNDPDYLDSLSTEAENELKHKLRTLSQEAAQDQNFYLQTLQQTNMKVMQKLSDAIETASTKVMKEQGIDLVINKEMCFSCVDSLDISKDVVKTMDETFEKEAKK
jgi:outer membrane protein